MTSVFLFILVAPTKERVVGPVKRVFVELLHLPTTVVLAKGFLSSHHTTQILTEIGSRSKFMIDTTIVEL